MKKIMVDLGPHSYPIYVGKDLLAQIGTCLKTQAQEDDYFVISDDNVARLYADRVLESMTGAGLQPTLFQVAAGESAKSLQVANSLYTHLIKSKATRKTMIIALGGGVVGDLAGFVAATFLRGVRFAQIPTTVLAQVDSSVGGKVGINHELGKNLIGAFYQPDFVLIDPLVLHTLPRREISAGLAEIIKYGLIRDESLFAMLNSRLSSFINLTDMNLVETILLTCCQIKADIVMQDEKETGIRALLNFGHTIGHALETVTGYQTFLHGEAVLLGMRGALFLSQLTGHLAQQDADRALKLINALPNPAIPPGITPETLLEAMTTDKKRTKSGLKWVLLKKIGAGIISTTVESLRVRQALEFIF